MALVAGVLVTRHGGGAHAPVAATPAPSAAPSTVFAAEQALDVSVGRGGTWVLQGGTLADVSQRRVTRSVPLKWLELPLTSQPRLADDPAGPWIWVVVVDAAPSRMIAFDRRSLRKVRDISWRQLVQGAVAYRRHLYLSTDRGVADLGPGRPVPRLIRGMGGAVGPVALDPTRRRVLAMDFGYPTDVWSYRPGHRPEEVTAPLRFSRGSLAVVAGRIWVAGYGNRGALLARLDPATLRPVQRAPAGAFGAGARIVGRGADVLWLRPADGGGPLSCVDAVTGRVEQRWDLPSMRAVASDHSGAIVATDTGGLGLLLSACAG